MTTTRPTQVTIDAYGLTDTGKVRKENEDHYDRDTDFTPFSLST